MPDGGSPGSALALGEFFEAGDARFLPEALACRNDRALGALAERWFRDPRPFARAALVAYVLDGCDRPRHRLLVKSLFKLAEAAGDDALMGCFLVALDRAARRDLVAHRQYDWSTRETWTEWTLVRDRSVPASDEARRAAAKAVAAGGRRSSPYALERFSLRTRLYLQRRAFRYFRRLGHRDPARYGTAIRAALARYRDEHLDKPERVLDAWGLLHALYWGEPALERRPQGIVLSAGHTMGDLRPAPFCPAAWDVPVEALLEQAVKAGSRTVRVWTLAWLETQRATALAALPVAQLRPLLGSPHPELQTFAARQLRTAAGLEALPVADWLALLAVDNPEALPLLCELVARHVAPARLTLAQKVSLATARPAPVAELGFSWIRAQAAFGPGELPALLVLREAAAPRTRAEAARWLCGILQASPHATPLHLRELLDARHADVRAPALELLAGERFARALPLWAAAAESPYDDVREALVRQLEAALPALGLDALRHLWATSLLAVHRGGRAKRLAAAQVARRVAERPAEADALLPLLRHLLRSVRAPERRTALGLLVRAALAAPDLRAAVTAAIPELDLGEVA